MIEFTHFNFEVLDSSNEEARRNLDQYPHGSVISTNTQTAGKGRLGRSWSSPPGKNIYMSIVIKREDLHPNKVNSYVQIAALALYETLKDKNIPDLRVKWPNDLLVKNAKIAGILCEGVFTQGKMSALIIGIGLNVNMKISELHKLGRPATSLMVETALPWNKDTIQQDILEKLSILYAKLLLDPNELSEMWMKAAQLKNQKVLFTNDKGESFLGKVAGFEEDGALILLCQNKKMTFYTGELTIKS